MEKTFDGSQVRDEPDAHRFTVPIAHGAVGAAYYQEESEGRLVLTHTEVPSDYMGHGIATALAQGVFDLARRQGRKLVPRCPFMAAWYAKHPDYGDVVAG